jgi:hypothetical protein
MRAGGAVHDRTIVREDRLLRLSPDLVDHVGAAAPVLAELHHAAAAADANRWPRPWLSDAVRRYTTLHEGGGTPR